MRAKRCVELLVGSAFAAVHSPRKYLHRLKNCTNLYSDQTSRSYNLNDSDGEIVSFGPFRLSRSLRTIEKDGVRLALGDRALDILIVLVERAGQIVSHREIISRAWRELVVNPSNLRVHMTGLRKALGDREANTRYIANVAGQGYCFVAPIVRESEPPLARGPQYPCGAARQRLVLPPVLARMVGRDAAVRTVASDLITDRFVTIIGPGGMGKTTVAVAVAHALLQEFSDAVCFVDIGAAAHPSLITTTIAASLGLTVQSSDVSATLLQCLKSLRVLLILDNCEHVIDSVASLAEQIYKEAPGVHILATSREALRVEGEHVYWLPPLSSPPREPGLSAAHALTFPAVRLFVERAGASGHRFELRDEDALTVAQICGRLDGIALAIEFAAGRVGTHGIATTAKLIDKRLSLHWQGRRTAIPRHQTLHALLDWSYGSLSDSERQMLRRLSIFVGTFTIGGAQTVALDGPRDESGAMNTVDSLVAKSLVSSVSTEEGVTRYRLLETTRTFALHQLKQSGESEAVALRHARYFAALLAGFGDGNALHRPTRGLSLAEHLGNVRACLEWCFEEGEMGSAARTEARDGGLAIELAVSAAPLFLELSLLNECHKWSLAGLALLNENSRGGRQEMVLQEARAISSTWTLGDGGGALAAITRALEIASTMGETTRRLRLLVGSHIFLVRVGKIRESLRVAQELDSAAGSATDRSQKIIAHWLLGSSNHFLGNQATAREHFERGFASPVALNAELFGLDHRIRALITFGRVLWLSGSAENAFETSSRAIAEAEKLSKPLEVCFSLLYSVPVFLWCGDLGTAHDVLERLKAHPNWHALPSLHATALALQGELFVAQGRLEEGIVFLRSAINTMEAEQQTLLVLRTTCVLAEALFMVGQWSEAIAVTDGAIAAAGDGSGTLEFPELLRIRADILLSGKVIDESQAELLLTEAMAAARRQTSRAWELRAAMSIARLLIGQGRTGEAHELLSTLYAHFTEGFETKDLQAARLLLEGLEEPNGSRAQMDSLARDRLNPHRLAI
jgi:predicted ATPase/DNA-binding winged helix-turn-helix (wHTH) protein